MAFDFLAQIERLTASNLTIREQARLAENPNDLRWRSIFPKRNVDSVRLSEFTDVDFRPAGGRREWNAQPREIPEVLGTRRDWEMIPINPKHTIDERRLQHLEERAALPQGGLVRELYDGGIIADVDEWSTRLTNAADVQIEADGFRTWFYNDIVIKDTKSNRSVTVSMGNAADRYVAAGTTLNAATNAWRDFLGYARDARSKMGSLGGVRLRQSALTEILIDAPAPSGDMATMQSLNQRMNAEGFGNFQFIVDERTYHDFTDGGNAYGTQYYVPETRMAFQPANGIVGSTAFAPVTRAWRMGIDAAVVRNVRDFTTFYSAENRGMTLVMEAQANALTLPTEQFVYVVTGI
jgi:hypothetical protein